MTISLVNGVNPLQTTLLELGIVSGRVALLLRSAEIQPVFGRFSTERHSPFTPILALSRSATGRLTLQKGVLWCQGARQGAAQRRGRELNRGSTLGATRRGWQPLGLSAAVNALDTKGPERHSLRRHGPRDGHMIAGDGVEVPRVPARPRGSDGATPLVGGRRCTCSVYSV